MDSVVRHPFMGKRRRTGARWLDGALIGRRQGRQTTREERGQRRSLRGSGVVVVGLTKTVAWSRCSRWRLAPCSAPTSLLSRTAPTRTRVAFGLGASATSRGAASPFSPPSLFPHSPSSLPLRRRTQERGKPQASW
jgi:hypothetical protein